MNNVLDLHGVRHGDVQRLMDVFLYEHMVNGTPEVKFITGNSERMKEIVKECLKEYDLRCNTSFFSNAILIVEM